eukprot:GHUV01005293.1.p1 GENE.GHUV01005293.1~~GHUV01005293.1.p1  ORF type:complete len:573 (+),score=229.02 GHUV01005293.1:273-1991(+)
MFALAVPAYINQTISSSRGTWPIAQCRVELGGGPGRRVMIRCSLSMPGRHSMPGSHTSPRRTWFGSTSLVPKDFLRSAWSSMLQNHRAWSEKSLQTLQRVGTLLRSTSKDCIAALATKKESAAPQVPGPAQPAESDQSNAGQLKASLSRFLATANDAEVQEAAMLSDLSNMAYDVAFIDPEQLQRHNLVMVAHSKFPAAAAQDVEAVATSSEPLPVPATRSIGQLPTDVAAGRPAAHGSPAAAAVVSTVWDAAPQYCGTSRPGTPQSPRSYFVGSMSPPASPRTPFILSSFSEYDDLAGEPRQLAATTAAAVADVDTPRRRPSALAATAMAAQPASSSWTAPVATTAAALDTAESTGYEGSYSISRSNSAGVALAAQLMHYQQQQDQLQVLQQKKKSSTPLQQEQQVLLPQQKKCLTSVQQEQQALLELQQQEQAVLLEMQQQQQLQMLLQQEQAIMQQLAVRSGSSSGDGIVPSRNTAWWWWQQQQQQAAAIASAAGSNASGSGSSTAAGDAETHPTDWFVCDEAASSWSGSPTRYVVIQGSITIDHWRINLTIDPCEFEGGALGHVKVHR